MITIEEFKNKITKKSRLLGLDLGSKRIGVAICDDRQSIATPFRTIHKGGAAKFTDELKLQIENDILDAFEYWLPFVQVRDLKIGMAPSPNDVFICAYSCSVLFNARDA